MAAPAAAAAGKSPPPLKPVDDLSERIAIFDAIAKFDPKKTKAWAALSDSFPVEQASLEANPEGLFKAGSDIEVTATIYASGPGESDWTGMSFPVTVKGKIGKGNKVKITGLTIDTSFFDEALVPWQSRR